MSSAHPAGNHLLPDHAVMEVRVADLRQLFNRMDPSPFRERDLDPSAEEFIIGWAQTVPAGKPLALVVHLERSAESPDEPAVIRDAIRDFFRHESDRAARRLQHLAHRLEDDRECRDDISAGYYSLYCALYKASIEIAGEYVHRRAALQVVRFTLEKHDNGRVKNHRLMDWNNHPDTSFAELKKVLQEVLQIVQKQLGALKKTP